MKYISVRGKAPDLNFEEVVLQGLASDGGLYVPEFLPEFNDSEIASMLKMDYPELVFKIIKPFIGNEIPENDLKAIITKSYVNFKHKAIAPLKQINHRQWLLELFHGPTLAFKDFALQLLGNIVDYILEKRRQEAVIIGATSGDTGSAAIEGCKNCQRVQIFIMYPHGKISEYQRRQMTTVTQSNVHNIALKGNFDDCQNILKEMFSNTEFLKGKKMVSVNSINWARLMAQIVYYFYAGSRLIGDNSKQISFCVPTGNFGDIYAGYLAKRMGLKVNNLIIATNKNDILTRFIKNNDYGRKELAATNTPSMDIQISSNFERLLYDIHDKKTQQVKELMDNFKITGQLSVNSDALIKVRELFDSYSVNNDSEVVDIIKSIYNETGEIIDPHTAIGVGAANQYMKSKNYNSEQIVILSTAHAAKFEKTVKAAGIKEDFIPDRMKKLKDKKEKFEVIENDIDKVKDFITSKL